MFGDIQFLDGIFYRSHNEEVSASRASLDFGKISSHDWNVIKINLDFFYPAQPPLRGEEIIEVPLRGGFRGY